MQYLNIELLHAGKVQRKFVLLAEPGSSVAAIIVELQKFAFVYYAVPATTSHGLHQVSSNEMVQQILGTALGNGGLAQFVCAVQVLDLGLLADESVTGAALVATPSGTRLIIATSQSIIVFDLPS